MGGLMLTYTYLLVRLDALFPLSFSFVVVESLMSISVLGGAGGGGWEKGSLTHGSGDVNSFLSFR